MPKFVSPITNVTKDQVGLSNVDNTSDVNKPVSTAQATANTSAKARTNHTGTQVASTISDFSAAVEANKPLDFTGTPMYGSYNASNPICRRIFHQSGTSDGTNGLITINYPVTYTAILGVLFSQMEPGGMVSIITLRADLITSSYVRLQTHTISSGAATVSKAYNIIVEVIYQL